jgi:hypothetical protein
LPTVEASLKKIWSRRVSILPKSVLHERIFDQTSGKAVDLSAALSTTLIVWELRSLSGIACKPLEGKVKPRRSFWLSPRVLCGQILFYQANAQREPRFRKERREIVTVLLFTSFSSCV